MIKWAPESKNFIIEFPQNYKFTLKIRRQISLSQAWLLITGYYLQKFLQRKQLKLRKGDTLMDIYKVHTQCNKK